MQTTHSDALEESCGIFGRVHILQQSLDPKLCSLQLLQSQSPGFLTISEDPIPFGFGAEHFLQLFLEVKLSSLQSVQFQSPRF